MTARSIRWETLLVALLLVVLMRAACAGPAHRWQSRDRAHSLILGPEAPR